MITRVDELWRLGGEKRDSIGTNRGLRLDRADGFRTCRTLVETFNRLVILGVALSMIVFGYKNYLTGFGSFLMPSLTPIAVLYAAIPVGGALVALFTVEELVNGWRWGFEGTEKALTDPSHLPVT